MLKCFICHKYGHFFTKVQKNLLKKSIYCFNFIVFAILPPVNANYTIQFVGKIHQHRQVTAMGRRAEKADEKLQIQQQRMIILIRPATNGAKKVPKHSLQAASQVV